MLSVAYPWLSVKAPVTMRRAKPNARRDSSERATPGLAPGETLERVLNHNALGAGGIEHVDAGF